jgi:hypothetical protein
MPARRHSATAALDLLARRVDLADQAQQSGATGQGVEAGRWIQGVVVTSATASTRRACVAMASAASRGPRVDPASRRDRTGRSTAPGAPLIQDAAGASAMAVLGGHQLAVGVEGQFRLARPAWRNGSGSMQPLKATVSRAASVGSPSARPAGVRSSGGMSWASLQRRDGLQQRAQGRIIAFAGCVPSLRKPSGE